MATVSDGYRILVVDDDELFLQPMLDVLGIQHDCRGAVSSAEALEAVREFAPDLVLLDIGLPDENGLECLKRIKNIRPDVEVIMVTGLGDVPSAVTAIKLGASEFVEKPFDMEVLQELILQARERASLRDAKRVPRIAEGAAPVQHMVSCSKVMDEVYKIVESVCATDLTVLIQGESGTGKELLARAIHRGSRRRDGPFVAVNCARFSGELIDSELFGHEKGAFTGAAASRRGVFELADGGTLFLDEIGTMPLATQDRLLRVVEVKRFTRVGGEKPIQPDVRLVFATNRDLEAETEKGSFREDLYYRMKVVPISVPPLRSRREDIPLLIEHFLQKHGPGLECVLRGFRPDAMAVLQDRTWRGNVRELENAVQMLMSLGKDLIMDAETVLEFLPPLEGPPPMRLLGASPDLAHARAEIDRQVVLRTLDACDWNQSLAAKRLGIHRNTLRNLMSRHGIRRRHSAQ